MKPKTKKTKVSARAKSVPSAKPRPTRPSRRKTPASPAKPWNDSCAVQLSPELCLRAREEAAAWFEGDLDVLVATAVDQFLTMQSLLRNVLGGAVTHPKATEKFKPPTLEAVPEELAARALAKAGPASEQLTDMASAVTRIAERVAALRTR
jgi:hypothetical protein